LALPLTALGGIGFSIIDKALMTRVLCVFLIIFSILKLRGKIHLKGGRKTMLIGGALMGFINGMLGISLPKEIPDYRCSHDDSNFCLAFHHSLV